METNIISFLKSSKNFCNFLQENNISINEYCDAVVKYNEKALRFVYKLSSNKKNDIDFENIISAEEIFTDLISLNRNDKINNLKAYKDKKLFGIDLGSYITTMAFNLLPGDTYLDVCCAPGTKLLVVINKYKNQNIGSNNVKVYANDISLNRLNTAKSIIDTYGFLNDVTFINKDARQLDTKDFNEIRPNKILVDIECSHDGSFKHVLKYVDLSYKEKLKNKKTKDSIIKNVKISKREIKRREKQKKLNSSKKSLLIR